MLHCILHSTTFHLKQYGSADGLFTMLHSCSKLLSVPQAFPKLSAFLCSFLCSCPPVTICSFQSQLSSHSLPIFTCTLHDQLARYSPAHNVSPGLSGACHYLSVYIIGIIIWYDCRSLSADVCGSSNWTVSLSPFKGPACSPLTTFKGHSADATPLDSPSWTSRC